MLILRSVRILYFSNFTGYNIKNADYNKNIAIFVTIDIIQVTNGQIAPLKNCRGNVYGKII